MAGFCAIVLLIIYVVYIVKAVSKYMDS